MKRGITILAVLAMLFVFTGTAFAAEGDVKTPTRIEVVRMLARLLGEAEPEVPDVALHPFDDVTDDADNWAVNALYTRKILRGAIHNDSRGKPLPGLYLDGGKECTDEMFKAMLLRTLGYDDDYGDITYGQMNDVKNWDKIADGIRSTIEDAFALNQIGSLEQMEFAAQQAMHLLIKAGDATLAQSIER